jgi:uncharacterized cofD-like protein
MLPQACRSPLPKTAPGSFSSPQRIVAIGGGTGLPAVLRSLRLVLGDTAVPDSITAIVAVTDDGGSTGQLRQQLQMLAPGDIRNCVAALAKENSPLASLLQHRFSGGTGFEGHALGNLILAALTDLLGDFPSAVAELSRIVGIQGRVLPATFENVHLRAEYATGEVVVGETAITAKLERIHRLSLERPVRPVPETIQALINADVVIVGPGSLYTSILPVLLVGGVSPTICGIRATRIYVANLMTEPGETDDFSLEEHLDVIEQHVGARLFDYVLVNSGAIAPDSLTRYARDCAKPVARAEVGETYQGARIVTRELAWHVENGKVRHDPQPLGRAIAELITPTERELEKHTIELAGSASPPPKSKRHSPNATKPSSIHQEL